MSLKLRYDVFGADFLKDAELVGTYEFPQIPGVTLSEAPSRIIPYDRIGSDLLPADWIHYYVHDCRFSNILKPNARILKHIETIGGMIGPDHSMYRDLPLAEQIHSSYLNRATDYYFHKMGKVVIPNVSWGDHRSYTFCCDGIAKESTIAVSTYGCCKSKTAKFQFEDGLIFVIEKLRPYSIMVHGCIWESLQQILQLYNVRLISIPTWREMKQKGGMA